MWEEGSFSGFLPARFSFSANREEQRAEKEKEGRASREINAVIRENGRRNNERQDRKGRSRGAGHVQDLEEQISSNASNFVKLNELMAQKAQAEEALEQKMDRWVYLNDLMEQIARERAEKKG